MSTSTLARRGRFLTVLAVPTLLAACVSEAPQAPINTQPRVASYACGEDGQLRIEASRGLVRVMHLAPDSEEAGPTEPVELPAAPPGQSTRYGKEGYALVIEGREALWMKAGRTPLTCTR